MQKEFISLEDIQPLIVECHAHTKEDDLPETVLEHTELCQKYFLKLMEQKGLEDIFENFMTCYFTDFSSKALALFEMMLINVVSFHDVGKINPLFQLKKMKHRWKVDAVAEDKNIGSKHSIISAVAYIQYFLQMVKQLENGHEGSVLRDITFIHSYIIAKHHGALHKFWDYLDSLSGNGSETLGWRAINWLHNWEKEVNGKEEILSKKIRPEYIEKRLKEKGAEQNRFLYIYVRLLYSLLAASDYYATSEYMNGIEIKRFGEVSDFKAMYEAYQNSDVMKHIRKYEKINYPMEKQTLRKQKDINVLRTEIFLEAERRLKKEKLQYIYYLEAPTGSGKSNTAMNLSFQLLDLDRNLKKIFYIYPFNTLVEQNMESLAKVFDQNKKVMAQIAVVNSLVPLKENENDEILLEQEKYQKILLDRQFLNYPIILSTHVALFRTMFGYGRENLFGFHQLCNSVIVLDEIQSYRNEIWSEIISFFKSYAKLLNIRVIIMSATLPNLEVLTDDPSGAFSLIQSREKYFTHSLFSKRVMPEYCLLNEKTGLDDLAKHVCQRAKSGKRILIEFIRKKSAYEFYELIYSMLSENNEIFLMTGDSSILERKEMIRKVKEMKSVILVATQVVEAGVDIDMDIGYKDISKLDSEEQFMGRINRSCKNNGVVFFFNLDSHDKIYKGDIRSDREYTLLNAEMREILTNKNYNLYYGNILTELKSRGERWDEHNLKQFFTESVGKLDFPTVEKRMKLIESCQMISVYLARCLETADGEIIDGRQIWRDYTELLRNTEMDYAKKTVKLFDIRSIMNGFIYQINQGRQFSYTEQIGDLFYIEDGEEYFENGVLNRSRLGEQEDLFI